MNSSQPYADSRAAVCWHARHLPLVHRSDKRSTCDPTGKKHEKLAGFKV
jgi:hypothetical protein